MPRKSGIGGHQSHAAGTVEWLTPPAILAALGTFDLDPCAPIKQPYPTASRTFTQIDDGLAHPWSGRVWLNPPYANGVIERWLARMAEHNFGTALIFARTETEAFFRNVWERATSMLFMEGRIHFHLPDGTRAKGNAGAPTVLCAYGMHDTDVLAACNIAGRFIPLRIPRSVLVKALARQPSWREAIAAFFDGRTGPVELDDLYRYFASHPKAAGKPNARAKIRQKLQSGPYRRVGRGQYVSEGT